MTAETTNTITVTSMDHFEKLLKESDVPVLFDFFAPWCGPCQDLEPVLEKIAANYAGRLIVAKINVEDHGAIADEAGVEAVPLTVLGAGGELQVGIEGFDPETGEQELREIVGEYVQG